MNEEILIMEDEARRHSMKYMTMMKASFLMASKLI